MPAPAAPSAPYVVEWESVPSTNWPGLMAPPSVSTWWQIPAWPQKFVIPYCSTNCRARWPWSSHPGRSRRRTRACHITACHTCACHTRLVHCGGGFDVNFAPIASAAQRKLHSRHNTRWPDRLVSANLATSSAMAR